MRAGSSRAVLRRDVVPDLARLNRFGQQPPDEVPQMLLGVRDMVTPVQDGGQLSPCPCRCCWINA
ncbi:hypothetical protein STRCI_008265 [Streptomyces cinnabarinus]|uniref:Uncharacterized protein n=1 Tax=Streptomyces cinnabarinus TaxID=67287 RepID=A0ABY7KUW2_9ACTN|nr:hypothetical protein [Streptomyces cinnabarinus]WAZ26659.1 hypothetical protein STRCI_008265 [Streptomyces cinnabarinus]